LGGGGAAAARNLGMSVCETDYLAFLDDDDEWLPDHLLDALTALTSDPALDVYACAARVLEAGAADVQPAVPYQGGGIENHFFGRHVWHGRGRRIVTPGLVARRWATSVQMEETLTARENTWWLLSIEGAGGVIRQFPEVGVVVHAATGRTASRVDDQSTVDWARRLHAHFPGRGADFLVGVVAREKCRAGDPRGVLDTWRLRRQVGGVTLRHRLPTSVEIAVACVLRLVSQVSRLRARQAPPSIEVDR
jgi:glycosyltransferase involved in cell wall biosynthesis